MSADSTAADLESQVIAWLRQELDDDSITGEDNFLDVGGHSMLAAELNGWLGDQRGVQLDIRRLFEDSLAKAVAEAQPVPA